MLQLISKVFCLLELALFLTWTLSVKSINLTGLDNLELVLPSDNETCHSTSQFRQDLTGFPTAMPDFLDSVRKPVRSFYPNL